MSGEVEKIAAGLTPAQRRAIETLPAVFTLFPISIARVTIKRLIVNGLLTRSPPASGFGVAVHRLSETGLAVKARLEARKP